MGISLVYRIVLDTISIDEPLEYSAFFGSVQELGSA